VAGVLGVLLEAGGRLQEARGRPRLRHERAAALLAAQRPLQLEHGERLAHGGAGDVEPAAQVRLRREAVPGAPAPALDRVEDGLPQLGVQRLGGVPVEPQEVAAGVHGAAV
jgi:hypothetical protein